MMSDRTDLVIVSQDEYKRLVQVSERVSVLERIVERNEYIPVEEIRAIFDLKPPQKLKKVQGEGL